MKLKELVGEGFTDNFEEFDLAVVQQVLAALANEQAIDVPHSEKLQQKTLFAADLLTEYLAKLIKTVSYLESKMNSVKNKVSLEYNAPEGIKTTMEMKKQAGESSEEVEKLALQLAKAKGAKSLVERKYEILLKAHHHFKDLSSNQKKTFGINSK
jgi:hypothetical protein